MAFHMSNYGSFASVLKPFADRDGYVPSPGEEGWTEECSEAVAEADKALAAWRASDVVEEEPVDPATLDNARTRLAQADAGEGDTLTLDEMRARIGER